MSKKIIIRHFVKNREMYIEEEKAIDKGTSEDYVQFINARNDFSEKFRFQNNGNSRVI